MIFLDIKITNIIIFVVKIKFPGEDNEMLTKTIFLLFISATAIGLFSGCAAKQINYSGLENRSVTGTKYACPMGEYVSDQPGKCPKCGMKLRPL
jgi:hypothetical protein